MPTIDPMILTQLQRDNVLRTGHFAFRSGRHGTIALDRSRLLADPGFASHMGYSLAKQFFTDNIETVMAPSIGGAGLAQWVAYFLDPKAKVVYAEPGTEGSFVVPERLVELVQGKRVLLVDNMIVTGETLGRFSDAVGALGGQVRGIGTIWYVGNGPIGNQQVHGLFNTIYATYETNKCPECAAGTAAEPVGH